MTNDPTKRNSGSSDNRAGGARLPEAALARAPRQEAKETPSYAEDLAQTEASSAATSDLPSATGPAVVNEDVRLKVGRASKRPKAEIETLEQFIEYAYGRKGQQVALKPTVAMKIAKDTRLDETALSRLFEVAKGDVVLAVPRQLLLLSRDIDGVPALRAALTSFVSDLMFRHPAFADSGVQGLLRNLPEGISAAEALTRVTSFTPLSEGNSKPLTSSELDALRSNGARLVVVWMAVTRGISVDEMSLLLFQALWLPATNYLPDSNSRLRALTEIEHAAGVGLACQRFQQMANEARSQQFQAHREAAALREQFAATETRLADSEAQLHSLQSEFMAFRERSAVELEVLRKQHVVGQTHLQHELEQLRGRLVKRLTDSVEMLEVGLSALRKESPRVPVMVERAEHVADALRAAINEMSEK